MRSTKLFSVLAAIVLIQFGLAPSSYGQAWNGILNSTRAIDWTQSGIPGGIPNRTTVCATINASTYGNGSSDATSGIQSALNSCPANQVVSLSSGTFRINSSVSVPSNVTLRGAGADATVLSVYGSSNGAINLGSGHPNYPGVSVTGGATAGSTSLVVSSSSGITVGSYLMITELNDSTYVSIQGGEGNCTWCDGGYGYNGTRARGQLLEVTSVSGTTVGFTPSLYTDYSHTPLVATMTATKYAGVEDIQVRANKTGYTADFQISGCAYCWIKGVEANYTDGDYVQVHYGYRDVIRDSYFSNAYNHSPGNTDSDIFLVDKTTGTLVENNIIERGHTSIMLNWGAAGNVIAYNYSTGNFDSGATNFAIGAVGFHGAHPQFNLLEGNVVPSIHPDQIWGSSSHGTLFRNWAQGTTKACNPMTGRGTVDCTGTNGWWVFQASRAMEIDHLSTYYNFVGNIAGSDNQMNLLSYGNPTQHVAILQFPSSRSYDTTNYNFTFGYGESGDDGSGSGCSGSTNPPCHSTAAYSTAFLHGNYTRADGKISWASGVTQTLPASFYLSGQPSWWKSTPYPAIGPDVTGGPGAGGHAYPIPAQACYQNVMGGSEGGGGSPLPFNANTCYYTNGSKPNPPTNLVATPQ